MVLDDINHEKIFSDQTLKLGKIHWYIQKSSTEMERKSVVQDEKNGEIVIEPNKFTDFGLEGNSDDINW